MSEESALKLWFTRGSDKTLKRNWTLWGVCNVVTRCMHVLCRYLHSLSHQQWQGLSQWESALPVWQCVMASWSFGKVLTMSFLHTAVMSPTPAGAGSVIWPSYPGGKLTTAGCNSNFILVSLLRCCYDGSAVTHVSNDKQSLIPCSPIFRYNMLQQYRDVNVVVLNQTWIHQPSDSSSLRWDEACIMYAAQFNVPWDPVPGIARARCVLCLPTMQFLHTYICLLNDPVLWKQKKNAQIIDIHDDSFINTIPSLSREANVHKQDLKPRYWRRFLFSKQNSTL